MRASGLILLTFACVAGLQGAEPWESINNFNFDFRMTDRLGVTLLSQLRWTRNLQHFAQLQGGGQVNWRAFSRVTLHSGYIFTDQELASVQSRRVNRPFGGVTVALTNGRVAVDSRSYYEYFVDNYGVSYGRARERIMVRWRRPQAAPYASAEVLRSFNHWTGRWEAGAQWNLNSHLRFSAGYQYRQYINSRAGHVIVTHLVFLPLSEQHH